MSMPSYQDLYFDTLDRPVRTRACDCPGCNEPGDFRAPKTRALTDYYFFCITHVRQYNASWDYFAGMSSAEIEDQIRKATVWDRPTWPLGEWQVREKKIRDDVLREFFAEAAAKEAAAPMASAEREAMAVLELTPPATFAAIKAQYRVLVKRWHPDLHDGSREVEEKFKGINQAFAVLREIYNADDAD